MTASPLNELAAFLQRFVATTDVQRDALTLWTLHTHAFQAAETTPRLHVTSAEKESGKTRLLEVLDLMAAHPLKTGSTTAAALARAVGQDPPPTLLLDETDNTFKRDREYVAALTGVLNDGYRRGGRTLLCLPPKWEPTLLPVFAPVALAGIGRLPDTLASRSILLDLKRRAPGEHVEKLREREARADAEPLRERLATWAREHLNALAAARPTAPDELRDRAADVWEPLLAIADAAGGPWPERARVAAVQLCGGGRRLADDSIGVRLLADIRSVFGARDRLGTKELLARLRDDEEGPWGDWRGKPLDDRSLAVVLSRYNIRSRSVRLADGGTPKGYLREQFEDAFKRYLPPEGPLSRHNATARVGSTVSALAEAPQPADVADTERSLNSHRFCVVADVANNDAHTEGREGESAILRDVEARLKTGVLVEGESE